MRAVPIRGVMNFCRMVRVADEPFAMPDRAHALQS